MTSLAQRLIKASGKSHAAIITQSNLGDKVTLAQTKVPILNVMFGGRLRNGITCGITQVIGDSRTFKCLDKDTPLDIYLTDEMYAKLQALGAV